MKNIVLTAFVSIACGVTVHAQNPPQQLNGPIPYSANQMSGTVLDAQVIQAHIPTKKVIEYPHLREADYIWSKRVWRTIDLREKINFPLLYPLNDINDRICLYHVFKYSVLSGKLMAFKPLDEEEFFATGEMDGDQFKYPVVPKTAQGIQDPEWQEEVNELFNDVKEIIAQPEPEGGYDAYNEPIWGQDQIDDMGFPKMDTTYEYNAVEPKDIAEYHIKEDWFFDKQRSVLDVRILGIAPVRRLSGGGKREMFWIYFPEARYILQNFFVYNERNDARRMSFDDLFWKRKFTSYVDKETNVFDRTINDYKLGIDALLEAEDIKNDIFLLEHDVWHF